MTVMAWTPVINRRNQSDEPSVRVHRHRITFNCSFSRLAALEKNRYVKLYVDDNNRKIGLEFKETHDDYGYKLVSVGGGRTMTLSVKELQEKVWVQKVSQLENKTAFAVKQEGKLWVIILCPAFEVSLNRADVQKIPTNARGIYRYMDDNKIVYIGKGYIKSRLNEEQRTSWKFTKIEYSVIDDEQDALYWENYWINMYKQDNNSELPFYNQISGHGKIE